MKEKSIEELENEANIAADLLEDILDTAGIDGDLQMSVQNGRVVIEIVGGGESASKLIGPNGETLQALQNIVLLAIKKQTHETARLLLDIDGWRKSRNEKILANAQDAINTIKETGENFQFDPMNSFERKLIHDLAKENGLYSYSTGAKPDRSPIITAEPLKEDEARGETEEDSEE